jgi:uncharacterized protein
MRIIYCLITLGIAFSTKAQVNTQITTIFSKRVNDSFELYVTTSQSFNKEKAYNVVYYCDANLKSGKQLREQINLPQNSKAIENTLFVGVGHIGNFHVLRRRDFILPEIKNGDTIGSSPNYGQTENFYQFLKQELIPTINSTYKTNTDNNSIFGHSLGGLFAFYCLFKNETVFKSYYALSPALWIDHYSIYNFNKLSAKNNTAKNIYFSAGGLEIMNHIKKGTDEMKGFLNEKKYSNINFSYEIHKNRTHNSQVELSIGYMLKSLM